MLRVCSPPARPSWAEASGRRSQRSMGRHDDGYEPHPRAGRLGVSQISMDPADQRILERAIHLGLQHAAEGLSGMIGHAVRLEAPRIAVLPIATIKEELTPAGEH